MSGSTNKELYKFPRLSGLPDAWLGVFNFMGQREIKFRAWYEDEHKMFKPTMVDLHNNGAYYQKGQSSDNGTWYYDVDLMQYTGLKDKNGVEIYEGDIVLVPYNYIGFVEVKFIKGAFNITSYNIEKLEIKRNIHQTNPLAK